MSGDYRPSDTALVITDPFNDFLSEGGKLWSQLRPVAEKVKLHEHLLQLQESARAAGIRIVFSQHRRWRPGDYDTWDHPTRVQRNARRIHLFEAGSWGGEFHPDFVPQDGDLVVSEHWAQSGFANTDLDFLLKQHRINKLILAGMLANSCIESTGRYAMELGYHVSLVTDATGAYSLEAMRAAHEINGPLFAHAIHDTAEIVAAFESRPVRDDVIAARGIAATGS